MLGTQVESVTEGSLYPDLIQLKHLFLINYRESVTIIGAVLSVQSALQLSLG